MTEKQQKLFNVVKDHHGNQRRKYTGDPYYVHLLSVAELVRQYADQPLAYEIALCHDLFEDTDCNSLTQELESIGYNEYESVFITDGVIDLTDIFTKEKFPDVNRQERKRREANRLGNTSALIQSIKYADLIDNTFSIVQYDPAFAKTYLAEKKMYLDEMRKGNIDLFIRAAWHLQSGLSLLEANIYSGPSLKANAKYPITYHDAVPSVETESDLPALGDNLN